MMCLAVNETNTICVPVWPWSETTRFSFSICSGREHFTIDSRGFYGLDVLPVANQHVRALNKTQNSDPNQWPGFIFSSPTTGVLVEESSLLLHWLPDASSSSFSVFLIELYVAAEFVVVHNGIITNHKDLKEFLVGTVC